jgi:hypothetical protein
MNSNKDRWDKAEVIIKIISSIVIPVLLLIYGSKINSSIKEQEINVKYIEIATGILNQPPEKTPEALRNWALDILKEYSKTVPLTEKAIFELKNHQLPTSQTYTSRGGAIAGGSAEVRSEHAPQGTVPH